MNKLLLLLLFFALLSCNKNSFMPKNGLTKSANEIIEYTIGINKDSLNREIRDTLFIANRKYRKDNHIIHFSRKSLFDNQEMEIEYVYNFDNQLNQEIVKTSFDSLPLTVNYFYKDSLLFQTKSNFDNKREKFEQIETHYYRNDKTKENSIMTHLYINKNSNDTITNSIVKAYYNQNEKNDSTIIINLKNQGLNSKSTYKYAGNDLILSQKFNDSDSLISTTKFEYVKDKFDNWIEKSIIENGELKTIIIREIKYN